MSRFGLPTSSCLADAIVHVIRCFDDDDAASSALPASGFDDLVTFHVICIDETWHQHLKKETNKYCNVVL